ncbi:hypothetical protein J132_03156 [Termitomyces sp. J132]|nr:hypothetical protein J132_03156 [Termitomyces sp. J132]
MESTLTPVSEELERVRAEKAAIKEELDAVKRSQEESNALYSRFNDLETKLQDAKGAQNAALASKERTKKQLQRGLDENARLKRLNERFEHALQKQKEEITRLEIALKESNNDRHILKKKLRVLTKQSVKLGIHDSHPDDSLQILEPEEESERRGRPPIDKKIVRKMTTD